MSNTSYLVKFSSKSWRGMAPWRKFCEYLLQHAVPWPTIQSGLNQCQRASSSDISRIQTPHLITVRKQPQVILSISGLAVKEYFLAMLPTVL